MSEALADLNEGSTLSASDHDGLAAWLALARVKGLGCASFKKLAEHLGDPRKAFSASEAELARVPGLDKGAIQGLKTFADWGEVREELTRVLGAGVRIVSFADSNYPTRLRLISDPPPFLYVKGEPRESDEQAVAVVGSRSASDYGLRITRELCRGLAALGFTVVSGLARGIDGEAHKAALASGGRTFAVLGSGVDVIYPTEHEGLYGEICQNGAVLSELPLGTPPFSYHFPARNRLISGVSLGVVVVEATEKSGSLITAGLALEQGREVFAVPGEAGASRSRGTHQLIRQGAKLVESVQDVVEEIAPQLFDRARAAQKASSPALPPNVSIETRKVFELILRGRCQIDDLIEASHLPPAKVSEVLLDLELQGFLRQLPGKIFKVN